MAARDDSPTTASYNQINGDLILNDLKGMSVGDNEAYRNIVDLFLMLNSKIVAQQIELENLVMVNNATQDRLKTMGSELNYLTTENEILNHKIAMTHDMARTMYLRLEGLSEKLNDNLPLNVANTLAKTGVTCTTADLDYVKRVGKFREGLTRPVLIRFLKEGKRNSILFNRNNINKNKAQNDPLIWLNDDVSEETRAHRKTVRDIAALAKHLGNDSVKVHGDGVIVGSNKYRHDELDLLPPNLSVTKAKSRDEDTGIYFQGEQSPYSNFHNSRFKDNQGQTYENVEQAFQHKKATAHGKFLLANKIMANRSPRVIKKLSKQIQTTKKWREEEEGLMTELVRAKFTQNGYLKKMLISTGNKQFHEATSDMKWGTGAELASKALLTGTWTGQDLLGQIIEKIREELLAAHNTTLHSNQNTSAVGSQTCETNLHDDLAPLPEDEDDGESRENHETDQSHGSHVTESNVSPRAKPLSSERSTAPNTSTPVPVGSPPKISTPNTSQHTPEKKKSPVQILQNIVGRNKRNAPPPPTSGVRQQRSAKPAAKIREAQPRGNRVTRSLAATTGK